MPHTELESLQGNPEELLEINIDALTFPECKELMHKIKALEEKLRMQVRPTDDGIEMIDGRMVYTEFVEGKYVLEGMGNLSPKREGDIQNWDDIEAAYPNFQSRDEARDHIINTAKLYGYTIYQE